MDPPSIIFPALFAGAILLSLPIIHRVFRRHHERMQRVADELGFTYHGPIVPPPGEAEPTGLKRLLNVLGPWRITGDRDGIAVTIHLEPRGKNNTWTVVEGAFPRPVPYRLAVGRESGLARLGKTLFGIQDVEVGSAEFDAEVRIKAADPEAARRLLADFRVRDRILAALRAWPLVTLTEKCARWEKRGAVEHAGTYRTAVETIVPIVVALRDAGAFEA